MKQENNFLKTVCNIAIPVALQCMLQSSFSMVDQIMIGQLGSVSIAAVGLAGKFSSIFSVVVAAIATVAGIMIAQYMGKQEREEVDKSFSVNLIAAIALAVIFTVLCVFFPQKIIGIYTEDVQTCEVAASYLRIIAITFLPMAGASLLSTMLRCMEKASLPLYASIVAAVINTVLNYVLIFGKFGFAQMGVEGAAIATAISQIANLLFMFIAFVWCYRKECRTFRFSTKLGKEGYRQYFVMLLPILVTEFLWSLGENVYASIYGHMGTEACAAMTLTNPIQGLMIGALSGVSQAAGILIGKSLGKEDYEEAYQNAKKLVRYGCVGALILGGGIIRSGGKTKLVMWIDLTGTWIFGVPLGFISAFVLGLSIPYVYFILSLEEVIRLAISVVVFRRKSWMQSLEM